MSISITLTYRILFVIIIVIVDCLATITSTIMSKSKTYKILYIISHKNILSHKKRKVNPEGSLDRSLFAAKLGFLKILVPDYLRIHQM